MPHEWAERVCHTSVSDRCPMGGIWVSDGVSDLLQLGLENYDCALLLLEFLLDLGMGVIGRGCGHAHEGMGVLGGVVGTPRRA